MPAEGDLRTNGIERSGQLLWIQVPVILLVVQAHHLLQERGVADLLRHSFEDHHFVPTLQVDRDGWLTCQVLRGKRTRAEIESRVEPDAPDRAAMRLTCRACRNDPIIACLAQPFLCPPPRQLRRSGVIAKHAGPARLRINIPVYLYWWIHSHSLLG